MENETAKKNGFDFFCNTSCEYFPCHNSKQVDNQEFNCLFCYCPLYNYNNCGGNFTYLENGCKDCSQCIVPHNRNNYNYIVKKLQEFRNNSNNTINQ